MFCIKNIISIFTFTKATEIATLLCLHMAPNYPCLSIFSLIFAYNTLLYLYLIIMYTLHETSSIFCLGPHPRHTEAPLRELLMLFVLFYFVFLKTTEIKSNYILRRLLGSNTYFHMHLLWRVYFEFLPF